MKSRLDLENIEIQKYLTLLKNKGFGHTIQDQEKRVRAGIAIAHEVCRQEIKELIEEKEKLSDALHWITQIELTPESSLKMAQIAKDALKK